ncbi:MAG: ATP cone domain-containing protein [Promethearchaeati archaeon SRVP18_Atabeyarchaeia-1]
MVDMVKVKKRDGRIEEFSESKIVAAVEKAGATAKQAAQVAKDIAKKVANMVDVTTAKLSDLIATELRKLNKKAADAYVANRDKKLKQKEMKK